MAHPTKDIIFLTSFRNEVFLIGDGDFSDCDFNILIEVLQAADDLYYNHNGVSPLADSEYDAIRRYCQLTDPNHTYFLGVGAEVRGGKVKLPYPMGSLDQVYQGEVESWIQNNKLEKQSLIVTEKLDGTSALVIYGQDGKLQIAYSRGDGVQGADITRHIRRFTRNPENVFEPLVIRGEVIFTKENFEKAKKVVKSRGGTEYKNARNMVAGLMNAEKNDPAVYQYLSFVAYEIINHPMDKAEQLVKLQRLGFDTPMSCIFLGDATGDEELTTILKEFRENSEYEIDGVVVDVNDLETRQKMRPSRDTLNPCFAMKYKVADASNLAITEVIEVEWNVSKHGYLKPRVRVHPVNLVGVTVQHATGFNAKFIHDNNIGPGAKIQITRSGDVIPFIQAVVKPTKAQMPSQEWKWNETEVDAVLSSRADNKEVVLLQTLDFFTSLKVANLKEGSLREVFKVTEWSNASDAIADIIHLDFVEWANIIGANGGKIFTSLQTIISDVPLHVLAGASPFFGRGVGVRKMKKLVNGLQLKNVNDFKKLTISNIVSVEGFDEKTAHKILNGVDMFVDFYERVKDRVKIGTIAVTSGGTMEGQKVVFTGFRDSELEAAVEAAGGQIQSAVSGKTTILVCADPNSNSGKAKKARDLGVKVIGVTELKEMLEE